MAEPDANLHELQTKNLDAAKGSPIFYFVVTAAVVVLVTAIVNRLFFSRKLNLPPGPTGIPILGTILQSRGLQTHLILRKWAKTWGPIYLLKTGCRNFVVVTSPEITYEALVKHAQTFSGRPHLVSRLNFTGWRSVNSAMYGSYWRGIRKNLVTHVLSTSKVASFLPFREKELETLIERVKEQAAKNDNVVNMLSHCRYTVFSILLHVCFGKQFDEATVKELDEILKSIIVILSPQVIDFLPWVIPFSSHKTQCQALLSRMRRLFNPLIEERRELRAKGQFPGDYLDSLLDLEKDMNLEANDILGLLGEVLAGGTDTTATTLEWAMGNLVTYPHLQNKLFEEIKTVCGSRPVAETDIENMPYMQAVIKETMRKHPALPLGITHGADTEGKLAGYDIPKDSFVLFHIQAVHHDPKVWENPEEFNPDRFLNDDPLYDMTGSHGVESMKFMPFGAGRRVCPGLSLGLKHAHLILSHLIQNFEWSTVNPGDVVDFSEKLEFTVTMTSSLKTRIKPRSM